MATTKGSLNLNTLTNYGTACFHQDGTVILDLDYVVIRSSEKDSTVDIQFTFKATDGFPGQSYYGFKLTLTASASGKTSNENDGIICNEYNYYSGQFSLNNVTATGSTLSVTLEGKCYSTVGCRWGSSQEHTWTFNIKVPTYDPYDAPTFTLNSYTRIGRLGSTNYNVNYTINKGSDDIEDLDIILLRYQSSWSQMWTSSINRNSSRNI